MKPAQSRASFQLTILGASGGPLESQNCSFLLKSYQAPWVPGCLLTVDAGTILSSMADILQSSYLRERPLPSLPMKNTLSRIDSPTSIRVRNEKEKSTFILPFPLEILPHRPKVEFAGQRDVDYCLISRSNALYILNHYINAICITHAHLDHILGLVVNSAAISRQKPLIVAGSPSTINALQDHIFNNSIWPNLTTRGENACGLINLMPLKIAPFCPPISTTQNTRPLQDSSHHPNRSPQSSSFEMDSSITNYNSNQDTGWVELAHNLLVSPMIISHGNYCDSTVFFIKDKFTSKVLVIWGDVEPDCLSHNPRNRHAWKKAARYLDEDRLAGIVIECSFNSNHDDNLLFGHFTPHHLIFELEHLFLKNTKIPLNTNLPIIIGHIKDDLTNVIPELEPKVIIMDELNKLADQNSLPFDFIRGEAGSTILL